MTCGWDRQGYSSVILLYGCRVLKRSAQPEKLYERFGKSLCQMCLLTQPGLKPAASGLLTTKPLQPKRVHDGCLQNKSPEFCVCVQECVFLCESAQFSNIISVFAGTVWDEKFTRPWKVILRLKTLSHNSHSGIQSKMNAFRVVKGTRGNIALETDPFVPRNNSHLQIEMCTVFQQNHLLVKIITPFLQFAAFIQSATSPNKGSTSPMLLCYGSGEVLQSHSGDPIERRLIN